MFALGAPSVAHAEVCASGLEGKTYALKDGYRERTLTNEAKTSTKYTGQTSQQWKLAKAVKTGGCQYYYIIEQEQGKYLIAGDKDGNDRTYMYPAKDSTSRDNAMWKFVTHGADGQSLYLIKDKKAGRTMISSTSRGSAVSAYAANRYNPGDLWALWKMQEYATEVCASGLEGKTYTFKDGYRERTLTNKAKTSTKYTGRKSQQWRLAKAADTGGCQYYYIIEQEQGKYLIAGNEDGNDQTFMYPEQDSRSKDNAMWKFVTHDASEGLYVLKDKKAGRTMISSTSRGSAVSAYSAKRYHPGDLWALWKMQEYKPLPECKSFLDPAGDRSRHRLVEITYSASSKYNLPKYEELAGYRVAHTQASIRLPDKGNDAYFMFSGSKDKHGSIWVVKVPNSNGRLGTAGEVVWSDKYANGCNDIYCTRHEDKGNFNHPAQMALVPAQDGKPAYLAVALQNYKAKLNSLTLPYPAGPDSLGFYDVSDPAAPVFKFRLVGIISTNWGGSAPPGSPPTLKNVAVARWSSGTHFMSVGKNAHYAFEDIIRLDPSADGRTIRLNDGSFSKGRAHIYGVAPTGTKGKETLLDMNFSGGDVGAQLVDASNNSGQECYYGFIDRYEGCAGDSCRKWRREACNVANGISHNWNGNDVSDVNFICHHKKPDARKFIVMEFTPAPLKFW